MSARSFTCNNIFTIEAIIIASAGSRFCIKVVWEVFMLFFAKTAALLSWFLMF